MPGSKYCSLNSNLLVKQGNIRCLFSLCMYHCRIQTRYLFLSCVPLHLEVHVTMQFMIQQLFKLKKKQQNNSKSIAKHHSTS